MTLSKLKFVLLAPFFDVYLTFLEMLILVTGSMVESLQEEAVFLILKNLFALF